MSGSRAKKSRRGLGVVAVVVVIVLIGGLSYVLTRSHKKAASPKSTVATKKALVAKGPGGSTVAACPLTDLPAPDGVVPQRPAVAIKVGNDPGARPQSGLNEADIVWEVQAEGGITRFIAVYQCQAPPEVGPIRSSRWVDWHVISQLGHPMFVFAGGILPDVDRIFHLSWLQPIDALSFSGTPFERITTRVPPENLYGSPTAIWALAKSDVAPSPIFQFSNTPPQGGSPVSGVSLPFSAAEQVGWSWNATSGLWDRTYAGVLAYGNSGNPLSASNVVVEFVNAVPGPYNESGPNSKGVHSETIGTGTAWVFRNGERYVGRWSRSSEFSATTYHDSDGKVITLAPGRTWVEIVPQWVHASVQ